MLNVYKKYRFTKANQLKYFEQVYRAIIVEEKKSSKYEQEVKDIIKEQKKLIEEMVEYVRSFDWIKHEKTKERVRVYTKARFDYSIMCEQLDIPYDAAKSTISYINSELKKKLGETTLNLLMEGRVEDARLIFYFSSKKMRVDDFMLDCSMKAVPEPSFMTLSLSECAKELRYLQAFSKAHFEKWQNVIDKDKMAYIQYIMISDNPRFSEDKRGIVKLLKGEKKVGDYIAELKEKEVY